MTRRGKVWAYRHTPKSGKARLHGKVALTVGGHWDAQYLLWAVSALDAENSMLSLCAVKSMKEIKCINSSLMHSTKLTELAEDYPTRQANSLFLHSNALTGSQRIHMNVWADIKDLN